VYFPRVRGLRCRVGAAARSFKDGENLLSECRDWGGREIEVKLRACLRDFLKADITPFIIWAKLGFHESGCSVFDLRQVRHPKTL
jgi:hypothetical protein